MIAITRITHDPAGDNFEKSTGQDMPCKFMEGKRILFASKFVIWDPKNGKIWIQAGSRGKPKRGKELKPEFKVDSYTYKEIEKRPFPNAAKRNRKNVEPSAKISRNTAIVIAKCTNPHVGNTGRAIE